MWCDHLSYALHKQEIMPLLDKVQKYVINVRPAKNAVKYVEKGGWRARMGGRGLEEGGNRVHEVIKKTIRSPLISSRKQTIG